MKKSELSRLTEDLIVSCGLPITSELSDSGKKFLIYPSGVRKSDGFVFDVEVGWRSIQIEFRLATFALGLAVEISKASTEQRERFLYYLSLCRSEGANVSVKINDTKEDLSNNISWPDDIRSFEFSVKKVGVTVNTEDHEESYLSVRHWALLCLSAGVSILPLEEEQGDGKFENGENEGGYIQLVENRYERSKLNRSLCIEYHGTSCKACGVKLAEKYGDVARNFIHVHHLTPLSLMKGRRIVDPINEMVPICPNCHAIIHLVDPPMSIDDLKKRILSTGNV